MGTSPDTTAEVATRGAADGTRDGAAAAGYLRGDDSGASTTTPTPTTTTTTTTTASGTTTTPANGGGTLTTDANGRSRFRWGDVIGGVLGVGGAWFLSNLFGGGWLGTIMFALFAIPAFMMGRQGLGNTLSGFFGEPQRPTTPTTPVRTPSTELAAGSPSADASVSRPLSTPSAETSPQQALRLEVGEVAIKSEIARQLVGEMAQSGRLNQRQYATMLNGIGRAQQMVSAMASINVDRLTPDELRMEMREFSRAENFLDRTLNNDPTLAIQIRQRLQNGVGAMASTQPPVIGAALTDADMARVQEIRNGAPQGYSYSPYTRAALNNLNNQPPVGAAPQNLLYAPQRS